MNSSVIANIEMLIRKKRGFEFEEFVNKLHLIWCGTDDYLPTRERKDNGADGIVVSSKTVIAAYGPDTFNLKNLTNKITRDFTKFLDQWAVIYPNWMIFYNQSLSPDLLTLSNSLYTISTERNIKIGKVQIFGIDQIIHLIETEFSEQQANYLAKHLGVDIDLLEGASKHHRTKIWEPILAVQKVFTNNKYELDYRVRMTDFFGREAEKIAIFDFLNDERKFCWWMIVGDGGMGKSRLAMEICLMPENKYAFSGFYLPSEHLDSWADFCAIKPTLIVIDYSSFHSVLVERIIETLSNNAESNLISNVRLLLLDREVSQDWELIKRANVNIRSTHFLTDLKPLELRSTRQLCWGIIEQFVLKNQPSKYAQIKKQEDEILDNLHEIDSKYRPLFAFLSAVAILEKGRIRDWSTSNLLDFHLGRLEYKIWGKVNGYNSNKRSLKKLEAINVIVRSISRLALREIIKLFFHSTDTFQLEEIYARLTDKEHTIKDREVFTGIQPDILGEFYLIDLFNTYIRENREEEIVELCQIAWDYAPKEACGTFMNLYQDFFIIEKKNAYDQEERCSYDLLEQVIFENDFFLKMEKKQVAHASLLIFVIIHHLSRENNFKAKQIHLQRLLNFYLRFPSDQTVAYSLSRSLYVIVANEILSTKAEIEQFYLPQLKELSIKFKRYPKIVQFYAQSVFDLTFRLGEDNRKEIGHLYIPMLKKLADDYPTYDGVAAQLAKALFNFTTYLESNELSSIKNKYLPALIKILKEHPDNQEIRISLAKCLANYIGRLNSKSRLAQRYYTLTMIKSLSRNISGNTNFYSALINCLSQINADSISITKKELQDVFLPLVSVIRFVELDYDAIVGAAKVLSDIIIKRRGDEPHPSDEYFFDLFSYLLNNHKDNEDLAVSVIARIFQSGNQTDWNVSINRNSSRQLEIILNTFDKSERAAVAAALLINNLSLNVEAVDIEEKYLPWIRVLVGKFEGEPNIARCDAAITYSLFNLRGKSEKSFSNIDELIYLASLIEKFPDSVEISEFYALGINVLLEISSDKTENNLLDVFLPILEERQTQFPSSGIIGHNLLLTFFRGIIEGNEKNGEYSEAIWRLFEQYEWYEPVKKLKLIADGMF